jgi:hypothetical protein
MSQMQTKEELVAQLSRLYRLQEEGKRVERLIEIYERLLFDKIEGGELCPKKNCPPSRGK